MGFKIPSLRHPGARAWAEDFRIAFGSKPKGKLPKGTGSAKIGEIELELRPEIQTAIWTRWDGSTHKGKSSKHRVFAKCPDCGEWVPAGRALQHKCKIVPMKMKYDLYWAPEGKKIATVEAISAHHARRMAPQPYRKYLGEIHAEFVGT